MYGISRSRKLQIPASLLDMNKLIRQDRNQTKHRNRNMNTALSPLASSSSSLSSSSQ